MSATLIDTPAVQPAVNPYQKLGPITSAQCEASGGHIVPVREWPPRKRHPHRPPSTSGICERCECNVAVPCPLTDVIRVKMPDGTVLDSKTESRKR